MTSIHKYTHTINTHLLLFRVRFVCVRACKNTHINSQDQSKCSFLCEIGFFFLYAFRENIHAVCPVGFQMTRVSFRIIIMRQNRSVCCWKWRLVIVAYYFYLRSCWRQYITLTHSTNQNLHRNCLGLFFLGFDAPLPPLLLPQKMIPSLSYSDSTLLRAGCSYHSILSRSPPPNVTMEILYSL